MSAARTGVSNPSSSTGGSQNDYRRHIRAVSGDEAIAWICQYVPEVSSHAKKVPAACIEHGSVMGCLAGFDIKGNIVAVGMSELLEPDGPRPTMVLVHAIGTAPTARNQGYAHNLFRVFELVWRGKVVIAPLNDQVRNVFIEKMGFQKIGFLDTGEVGTFASLLVRNPDRPFKRWVARENKTQSRKSVQPVE